MTQCGRIDDVRRLAVLRANGIGDLVFVLPALEALRAAYRTARVTYLGGPMHAELLPGRVATVDEVVVVPPSQGVWWPSGSVEDEATLAAFFAEQRGRGYDVAVQLHGGGAFSNPFLRRLGARVTVGLRAPDAPPLDRTIDYVYYQTEILRYLEVVGLLGAPPVTVEPRLTLRPEDRAAAARAAPSGADEGPLVVVNPGATDPRRRWPPERFAAVADVLAADGASVVVVGDAGDRPLADAILAAMRAPARSLAGALPLGPLCALLARAALVVSNDTGPLHLARAVRTPTVGIYWIGNMINGGWTTTDRHRAAISWTVACPQCGTHVARGSCTHRPSYVADVPVEEVVPLARDLLRGPRSQAAEPADRGR
ncbi:MAG TPA: glycosyltransferase family 9 protein [Mycobacteriales bacterium]|nr:glycosyltransferase family 9 protein [Mycobacteriales bacterium]